VRKTKLKHTTAAVIAVLVTTALVLSALRVSATPSKAKGASRGAALFEAKGCGQCHYTNSKETKIGPGLQGLSGRESLPMSGKPVTAENIRDQLMTPYKNMPSFADRLSEEEIDHLIEYLKTL